MSIWFTSDQHYYHTRVIEYCNRPYATVEEMNEDLVKRFNSVVTDDDVTYHLGDFSLAHRAVEVFLPRLNGIHYLIAGNHDHCHPAHYGKKEEKGQRMRKLYFDAGFKWIELDGTMEIAGKHVKLNHFPYLGGGDHAEKGERFADYRLKDQGAWLLHGHVHNTWKTKGRMINVGCDVWDYYPVSLDAIAKLIAEAK